MMPRKMVDSSTETGVPGEGHHLDVARIPCRTVAIDQPNCLGKPTGRKSSVVSLFLQETNVLSG